MCVIETEKTIKIYFLYCKAFENTRKSDMAALIVKALKLISIKWKMNVQVFKSC